MNNCTLISEAKIAAFNILATVESVALLRSEIVFSSLGGNHGVEFHSFFTQAQ
jgi:hypothetical protein